jgi:orotidine-5'-phosphate decarboxylase
MTFADRTTAVLAEFGQLCVGIDPHEFLLADWELTSNAAGAREFGLRVVDAVAGRVGFVKPQVAFFERFGSAGYAALEDVLAAARTAGLFVIADCKRGDMGTSVDAYGAAWLTPGSPLEADAMTATAYQGLGSLAGVLARAQLHDKGVIVVTAASNPEAAETQGAIRADGRTVAAALVDDIRTLPGTGGVVIGATVDIARYGITTDALAGVPILAPGFGAQGVAFGDLPRIYGAAARQALVSSSRELLSAGPGGLAAAVDRARNELREAAA